MSFRDLANMRFFQNTTFDCFFQRVLVRGLVHRVTPLCFVRDIAIRNASQLRVLARHSGRFSYFFSHSCHSTSFRSRHTGKSEIFCAPKMFCIFLCSLRNDSSSTHKHLLFPNSISRKV